MHRALALSLERAYAVAGRQGAGADGGGQFLDGRKAREELGFVPRQSLDDALGRAIRWLRGNGYLDS